jgi:hypothetical protein
MTIHRIRKYNAFTEGILIPLYDAADPNKLVSGVSFVAGDVTLSKDEGTFTNITNAPTEVASTGIYKVLFTGTDEMKFKRGMVKLADQSDPKIWMDTVLTVDTVGNAAAQFQPDYTDAPDVSMKKIGTVLVSDAFAAVVAKATKYTVDDTGFTPTKTDFQAVKVSGDGGAAVNDILIDRQIYFTTGANAGAVATIQVYRNSPIAFTVSALQVIPADLDEFIVM